MTNIDSTQKSALVDDAPHAKGPRSSSNARLLQHLQRAVDASSPFSHGTSDPVLLLSKGGSLKLRVLVSTPRHARELYALSHVHPTRPDGKQGWFEPNPVESWCEKILVTASWEEDSNGASGPPSSKLIYALETFLYTLPNHRSAVLYVSKLDTTGYGPGNLTRNVRKEVVPFLLEQLHGAPSTASSSRPCRKPITLPRLLTEAFLDYFSSFAHWSQPDSSFPPAIDHLSLHILARAQATYLFPASPDNGLKHVLSDAGLIRWWRRVISEVIVHARRQNVGDRNSTLRLDPFYLVPGYNRLESAQLIPLPQQHLVAADGTDVKHDAEIEANWTYGHPYAQAYDPSSSSSASCFPLPLFHRSIPAAYRPIDPLRLVSQVALLEAQATDQPQQLSHSIANLMPRFEDDPKGRFLDELVRDAHEHAGFLPKRDRELFEKLQQLKTDAGKSSATEQAKTAEAGQKRSAQASPDDSQHQPSDKKARLNIADDSSVRISVNTLAVETEVDAPSTDLTSSQRDALLERAALDVISAEEFWERMGFRQECCSGNAVGVFVVLFTRQWSTDVKDPALDREVLIRQRRAAVTNRQTGWTGVEGSVSEPALSELILKQLLLDRNDWSTAEKAAVLTQKWDEAVGRMLKRRADTFSAVSLDGVSAAETAKGLGKGMIWDAVVVPGITEDHIVQAKAAYEIAKAAGTIVAPTAAPVQVVTSLSVKRKKKA